MDMLISTIYWNPIIFLSFVSASIWAFVLCYKYLGGNHG